jgi:hypothetical protein
VFLVFFLLLIYYFEDTDDEADYEDIESEFSDEQTIWFFIIAFLKWFFSLDNYN